MIRYRRGDAVVRTTTHFPQQGVVTEAYDGFVEVEWQNGFITTLSDRNVAPLPKEDGCRRPPTKS